MDLWYIFPIINTLLAAFVCLLWYFGILQDDTPTKAGQEALVNDDEETKQNVPEEPGHLYMEKDLRTRYLLDLQMQQRRPETTFPETVIEKVTKEAPREIKMAKEIFQWPRQHKMAEERQRTCSSIDIQLKERLTEFGILRNKVEEEDTNSVSLESAARGTGNL